MKESLDLETNDVLKGKCEKERPTPKWNAAEKEKVKINEVRHT